MYVWYVCVVCGMCVICVSCVWVGVCAHSTRRSSVSRVLDGQVLEGQVACGKHKPDSAKMEDAHLLQLRRAPKSPSLGSTIVPHPILESQSSYRHSSTEIFFFKTSKNYPLNMASGLRYN